MFEDKEDEEVFSWDAKKMVGPFSEIVKLGAAGE